LGRGGGVEDREVARLFPFELVRCCKVKSIVQHSENIFMAGHALLIAVCLLGCDVDSLLWSALRSNMCLSREEALVVITIPA
jgi:hypothetical protein